MLIAELIELRCPDNVRNLDEYYQSVFMGILPIMVYKLTEITLRETFARIVNVICELQDA